MASTRFGRLAARFLVALVAVLLFAGWLVAFAVLLRPRPRATIPPGLEIADHASVAFSPNGKLIATWHKSGPIQVRDASGSILFSVADAWEHIQDVLFSRDSTLLAAYQSDGDLKVWDIVQGNEIWTHRPVTKDQHWVFLQFTPKGNFLVVQDYGGKSAQGHVTFYDPRYGAKKGTLDVELAALEFSLHEREFTAWCTKDDDTNGRIQRWRYGDGEPFLQLVSEHALVLNRVGRSDDDRLLATLLLPSRPLDSVKIEVREARSLRLLVSWTVPCEGRDYQLDFSPDGRLLAIRPIIDDRPTLLWEVTGEEATQVGEMDSPVFALGGSRIVAPVECGAELYTTAPLQKLTTLTIAGDSATHPAAVLRWGSFLPAVKCSPDGRLIAVARLYVVGERSFLFEWFSTHVYALRSEGSREVVRVWDAETGREHASFEDSTSLVFSPNGKLAAVFRSDGAIDVWDIPVQTFLNGWVFIIGVASATTTVSLAALRAAMKGLSRRTAKSGAAERAEPAR